MTITSPTNKHILEARRLTRSSARHESGRFVAEGEDLNEAAAAAGTAAHFVLCAEGHTGAPASKDSIEVSAALMAKISTLGSSSRMIGVYDQSWHAPAGPLAVALWGVRDPGNIGTILRSAVAFGASSVVLGPGSADPYSPKAVRASMGAIFTGTLARCGSIAELPGQVVALVPGAGKALAGPLEGTVTLLLGGEREGLPQEILEQCHDIRHIRQLAGDSLNVAMAATVALYEVTRMAAG
ncbi:MAG TPA: RNA methyltransferase [Solirubrobacteraceae bacterium]|jgi:TrmH family RNA methyltransferase